MEYYVEVKNVPSLIVLSSMHKCKVAAIDEAVSALYEVGKKNENDSLFCISDQAAFEDDQEISICCPINSIDLVFDRELYKIEVLHRSLMLSIVKPGKYPDLKDVFTGMAQYIEKNKLYTRAPYRIICHREKRAWVRTDLHTSQVTTSRPKYEYVTEVQVPLINH